jgi:oligosaccharide reducing-end xylanase
VALALAACGSTTDSLGYNDTGSTTLHPLTIPASYPNPFRDLLGETDAQITTKINNAYNQLFNPANTGQTIFFNGPNPGEAYVQDTLHNDVRTEGMGLGMMVTVELNKQTEFDELWTYAKNELEVTGNANAGYFNSFCDDINSNPGPCLDPFGFEQFVTALIFAHDRWGSTGTINYEKDALALFHTLRHKEDDNGGIVDGVTNTFDPVGKVPLDIPNTSAAGVTRPSLIMPGYYTLWAEADADPTFSDLAASGRAFLQTTANPTTGMTAVRANFDGTPTAGWAMFNPESYRTEINAVIDQIWTSGDAFNITLVNNLLAFFSSKGINSYGKLYSLDGTTCYDTSHEPSLVLANGIAALASTNSDRSSYVSAVWNMATPTSAGRYYSGILDLVALLILGGQFQVY